MRRTWVWFSWVASTALLLACGGSAVESAGGSAGATGGGSGGGGSAGSGGSAGTGGGSYVGDCPSTEPTAGSSCSSSGEEPTTCSYGDDWDPNCRSLYMCDHGKWKQLNQPDATYCTSQPSDCPTNVPEHHSACDKEFADKLTCGYASAEKTCSCATSDCAAGPCMLLDPPAWVCRGGQQPAPGCPPSMPNVGTSCSKDVGQCEYGGGACVGGATVQCIDGVWSIPMVACPQ